MHVTNTIRCRSIPNCPRGTKAPRFSRGAFPPPAFASPPNRIRPGISRQVRNISGSCKSGATRSRANSIYGCMELPDAGPKRAAKGVPHAAPGAKTTKPKPAFRKADFGFIVAQKATGTQAGRLSLLLGFFRAVLLLPGLVVAARMRLGGCGAVFDGASGLCRGRRGRFALGVARTRLVFRCFHNLTNIQWNNSSFRPSPHGRQGHSRSCKTDAGYSARVRAACCAVPITA